MNANYIYDIFQTCEDLDLPDLTVALAHVVAVQTASLRAQNGS